MKTISLGLPIAAAMLFLAPSLRAADATPATSSPASTVTQSGDRQAALIKRFDKNGDGKLDSDERAAMREERQERTERRREFALKRFDKNGDGVLDESERTAALNDLASRPRFIRRFDKDGDGKLSPEELAGAKQTLAERWAREAAGASGSSQPSNGSSTGGPSSSSASAAASQSPSSATAH